MFKRLFAGFALAAAAILVYAATRPDHFRVERSIRIAAPPAVIYALIADFHRWPAWSPYERKDPRMQRDYRGASAGLGAIYAWNGNGEVGAGSLEISEAAAPVRLVMQLRFERPLEAHNIAEFTLQPQDGMTQVRWAMSGPAPYVSKLIGVFVDMDRMIGRDFEAGLAALKTAAER